MVSRNTAQGGRASNSNGSRTASRTEARTLVTTTATARRRLTPTPAAADSIPPAL